MPHETPLNDVALEATDDTQPAEFTLSDDSSAVDETTRSYENYGPEQGAEQLNTTSPAYESMEQMLGQHGMTMLGEQLRVWQELNERPIRSSLRDSLRSGDATLPEGTLVHGIGMNSSFSEAVLSGVARLGIVSGELIGTCEDAETHGCADFFKVPADMTVGQYMKYIKEPVQIGRSITSRGESFLKRDMAFIVDPNAEGMDELMKHDGYADPEMGDFVRTPSRRTSADTAAILGGVPAGSIAGILLSPKLLENPSTLDMVRTYFPETPVLDHEGALN